MVVMKAAMKVVMKVEMMVDMKDVKMAVEMVEM